MNTSTLSRFKSMFESQKVEMLALHKASGSEFHIDQEEMRDEMDVMTSEMDTSMRMRLRSRETLFLKKIDEALARIQDGSFGECEECSEEIESRRLEARPTTTLCLSCKEEQERSEQIHIDGTKHKSLGARLRFA